MIRSVSLLLALSLLSVAALAHAAPPAVDVPAGSNRPVLIDGTFEREEWSDARAIDLGDSVFVLVKERVGHVWLGIRCPFRWVAVTDVFLALDDGPVWKLHASAQLSEQSIARAALGDTLPPARFGYTKGWYANETRFDRGLAERLVREDPSRDRMRMLFDTTYPYDGFEFRLKHERFPGARWRLRVELNPGFPGFEPAAYPAGSSRTDPETWLPLVFP